MNSALQSALSHFEKKNGELYIGDRSISTIATEFGTPSFVYAKSVIERKHKLIRDTLPQKLQIYYSIKANPNFEIVQMMGQCYDGVDVASEGEMQLAIKAGISRNNISFTGPGKRFDELYSAIKQDIGCITIESEREIEHISSICKELKKRATICIRINPPFEITQSGMRMGGGPGKFGVDSDTVPNLIKDVLKNEYLRFDGIHIFTGSQNLQSDKIIHNFGNILQFSDHLSSSMGIALKSINMGGGFGIPYFAKDEELDINQIGIDLKRLLDTFWNSHPETSIKIESGRFLVGECGIYLSRVLYRKVSHDTTFIIIDGGMHHHLAASGNLGQSLARRPMPLTTANKLDSPMEKVHVSGPLCTPLDTFGNVDIPKAEEGDFIAVLNSGAYGLTASPAGFLSHALPREIIL